MQNRVVFMVALGIACAGSGDSDLASAFRETPFRSLPGVELGMTGKRLHAVRPGARYAPYLGLQERIPGFVVSYQFPMSTVETTATDVRPEDTLEGVFISQPFATMEEAETTWREKVRAVTSSHRAPTLCESVPNGGMQARWVSTNRVFAIGVFPQERMAPITNRVIYAFSQAESMKQPAGATKMACPTS
jgi:hypothetical protein